MYSYLFAPLGSAPGEPPSEEERRQQMAYEDWMMQQNQWLAMNIKSGEGQMAKFRKAKKAINAKVRQVDFSPIFRGIKREDNLHN